MYLNVYPASDAEQQPEVLILQDGFSQFQAQFRNDKDLVEKWDEEIWAEEIWAEGNY